MLHAVIIRTDQTGSTAFIHREDSAPLEGEAGVRYRLVSETDDHGEAVRVVDVLQRRIRAGELPRATLTPY